MPPKRKRADDGPAAEASTSTRATRSSTRISNATKSDAEALSASTKSASAKKVTSKGGAAKSAKATKALAQDAEEVEDPPAPPAKKSKTKSKAAEKTKKSSGKDVVTVVDLIDDSQGQESGVGLSTNDDEPSINKPVHTQIEAPSNTEAKPIAPAANKVPPQPPAPTTEPYSLQRSLALFDTYAESDNPDIIGTDGFVNLCTDANIPLEGALPLILAWQLGAKEMGKLTKDEWSQGTETLKISTLSQLALAVMDLENLLISGQPALKKSKKEDPYDRTAYWKYAEDKKAAFRKLYAFCFVLAKPEQSRNIDMETSTAFWSVLLVPKFPLMSDVVDFINEKGTYKATNKDLWSMMLEFCETVKPTLQDYEADGAWPTLLDDFVASKKVAVDGANGEAQVDE